MPKSEQNLSKMEFWKIACALEKELTFILMKDFGIKPRAREPNFFSKVYNMKTNEKGNKNIFSGGMPMSWMGWVAIVIMGFNILFFGMLGLISLIDEWKERRHR